MSSPDRSMMRSKAAMSGPSRATTRRARSPTGCSTKPTRADSPPPDWPHRPSAQEGTDDAHGAGAGSASSRWRPVAGSSPQSTLPPPAASAPAISAPAAAPVAANALLAGLAAGPALGALALDDRDAAGALASFIESCPKLLVREDASGLTRPADWRRPCAAAGNWPQARAREFFHPRIQRGAGR